MIVWDPNKAIDIGSWSICGGGWLDRFYCIIIYSGASVEEEQEWRVLKVAIGGASFEVWLQQILNHV